MWTLMTIADPDHRARRVDLLRRAGHWLTTAAIVAALGWYGGFLFRNLSFGSGGPDSSGYMNGARAIASQQVHEPVVLLRRLGLGQEFARMFVPLGFASSPGRRMHPTYPPGLSLHLALAGEIGGWEWAPFIVTPLAALAAVFMMYAVGLQLGLGAGWSGAAGALLAVSPPFIWHAVQAASDDLAVFWALFAVWAALASHKRPSLALLSGAAFGAGVWVRPTNLLLALPLLIAFRFRVALLLRAAASAFPFGAGILWWNAAVYGGAFKTGYGTVGDVVSWSTFGHTWTLHVRTLKDLMTRVVFPTGLLVLFDWRAPAWRRAFLVTWFAVFLFFYASYGFFDGWLCMRFLLPAIPAVIFGLLIVLRDVIDLLSRSWLQWAGRAAAASLIWWVVMTSWATNEELLVFRSIGDLETIYPQTIEWAECYLPDDAIVVAGVLSGAFHYYAGRPIVRPDQLTNDDFQMLRAYAGNAGLKWYAVISSTEGTYSGFDQRLRGRWTAVAQFKNITLFRLDS